jgi:hypothetical protein
MQADGGFAAMPPIDITDSQYLAIFNAARAARVVLSFARQFRNVLPEVASGAPLAWP